MGKRYIAIVREGAYGVYNGPANQYIDIVSESISPEQGMIDIETAGEREWRHRVPGGYTIGGSIDMVVNPDNIGRFLLWALGEKQTDASGACYRHEFKAAQEFDSFSLDVAPAVTDTDSAYYMRRIVGCAVTSLGFEAVAREALTATVDIIGRSDTIVSDPQAPTFSALRPFIFFEGSLGLNPEGDGGPVANVEAFRVTIDNDIAEDAFVLGSRFLPGLRIQGITISGDFDLAFEDWEMYRRFYDGTATATGPSTSMASVRLVLTFTGPSTGCAAPYDTYKLILDLPQCYLDTTEASFDRRERIVQSVSFTATYDDSREYSLLATLFNRLPYSTSTTTSSTSTSTTSTSTSTTSTSTTSPP